MTEWQVLGHVGSSKSTVGGVYRGWRTTCPLSTKPYFTLNISFVGQTTAVNPLLSVYTVWPYYSRVNTKDPDGYTTRL